MAISRYRRNLTPVRSSFVEQPWVPDFQMLGDAVTRQQKFMDEQRKMALIPTDGLQGADLIEAQEINDRRLNIIEEASQTFMDQGINAGNRFLRDRTMEIMREELPGGVSYDLKQRKKNWLEFQKKQSERLQKNEISKAQYYSSVTKEFDKYKDVGRSGGATLNMSGRPEKTDIDELANKYLANHKQWGSSVKNGQISVSNGKVYYNTRHLKKNDVAAIQRELATLFRQRLQETGELKDLYEYTKAVNPMAVKDGELIATEAMADRSELKSEMGIISEVGGNSSEMQIRQAQQLMNSYLPEGSKLIEDGVWGKNTKRAQQFTEQMLDNQITGLNRAIDVYNTAGSDALSYQSFAGQYVTELARPYAATKNQFEELYDIKSLGDLRGSYETWALKEKYKKPGWVPTENTPTVDPTVIGGVDKQDETMSVSKDKDGNYKIKFKNVTPPDNSLNGYPIIEEKVGKDTTSTNVVTLSGNIFSMTKNPTDETVTISLDPLDQEQLRYLEEGIDANDPRYKNVKRYLEQQGAITDETTVDEEIQLVSNIIGAQRENVKFEAAYRPYGLDPVDKTGKSEAEKMSNAVFSYSIDDDGDRQWSIVDNRKVQFSNGKVILGKDLPNYDDKGEQYQQKENGKKRNLVPVARGEVDNPLSTLPYGTIVAGYGRQPIYIHPSAGQKKEPEFFFNVAYRAREGGAAVGRVRFDTDGILLDYEKNIQLGGGVYEMLYDMTNHNYMLYTQKPDGEFEHTGTFEIPDTEWHKMSPKLMNELGVENVSELDINFEYTSKK